MAEAVTTTSPATARIDGGIGAITSSVEAATTICRGDGGDSFFGGESNDPQRGNDSDTIRGAATLIGGAGADTIFGGVGDDAAIGAPRRHAHGVPAATSRLAAEADTWTAPATAPSSSTMPQTSSSTPAHRHRAVLRHLQSPIRRCQGSVEKLTLQYRQHHGTGNALINARRQCGNNMLKAGAGNGTVMRQRNDKLFGEAGNGSKQRRRDRQALAGSAGMS